MLGSRSNISSLVDAASRVFGLNNPPYLDVPLPRPLIEPRRDGLGYFEVSALWTKDGLRPRWGNLAVVAASNGSAHQTDTAWWKEVVSDLHISLAVLASGDGYTFVERSGLGRISSREVTSEDLQNELVSYRSELFSPRSLSDLRSGQLSFADLEDSFADHTFAYHLRHKTQLDDALKNALTGALRAQVQLFRVERKDFVERDLSALITVSIAYLAARILEDKGFVKERNYNERTNDPRKLLDQLLTKTNSFFQIAARDINLLQDTVLQQLALFLGRSVTFSLVDHKDVGHLYEQTVRIFQSLRDEFTVLKREQIANLQQHYTPQAIADNMLDLLPIERIRPEERIIFDPAAGSGSLLLAATRRLTLMPDVHPRHDKKDYLSGNVMGNDLDEHARLITKLRYSLAQEAFGFDNLFPDPDYFGHADYHHQNAWNLPSRPRVVVANPPFAEENATQRAVRFIKVVVERLQEGDQFAIVLPQTFLAGTTHGWASARRLLSNECRVIETWQLPEGSIGLSARQPVCFVLGIKTTATVSNTVSRAIVSGAQMDLIRDKGFLGQAWVTKTPIATDDWRDIVAPAIGIQSETSQLGDLFYICTGVGPKKGVRPVSSAIGEVPVKRYWRNQWRKSGSVWANPDYVPFDERYIRFSREYLEGHRSNKAPIYDSEKLLLGRITNRNSKEPLAVSIDTTGLCPNKNVFCLAPYEALVSFKEFVNDTPPTDRVVPSGWEGLETRQKLLWLLGILSSDLAIDVSLTLRDARYITSDNLSNFPLPDRIDRRIIDAMEIILEEERKGRIVPKSEPVWRVLNEVVEESYGASKRLSLVRTGQSNDLKNWLRERGETTETVTGQVLEVSIETNRVKLYLEGLLSDDLEAWIPLPPEMPGWALDGTVFDAEASSSVKTFEELSIRPWALRNFRHTPRPYLTVAELQESLLSDAE